MNSGATISGRRLHHKGTPEDLFTPADLAAKARSLAGFELRAGRIPGYWLEARD